MGQSLAKQLGQPQGFLSRFAALFFTWNNDSNTKWVISELNVQPGAKVLVIGFGTGTDIAAFVERVGPTGMVYGIEISEDMLRIASERHRESIEKGLVKLEIADAQHLDVSQYPKFDYIFHSNVVYFWDDPVRVYSHLSQFLVKKEEAEEEILKEDETGEREAEGNDVDHSNGKIVSCVVRETAMTRLATRHFKRHGVDDATKIEQYCEEAKLIRVKSDTNSRVTYVIHSVL